jgi:hypothetical protein
MLVLKIGKKLTYLQQAKVSFRRISVWRTLSSVDNFGFLIVVLDGSYVDFQ